MSNPTNRDLEFFQIIVHTTACELLSVLMSPAYVDKNSLRTLQQQYPTTDDVLEVATAYAYLLGWSDYEFYLKTESVPVDMAYPHEERGDYSINMWIGLRSSGLEEDLSKSIYQFIHDTSFANKLVSMFRRNEFGNEDNHLRGRCGNQIYVQMAAMLLYAEDNLSDDDLEKAFEHKSGGFNAFAAWKAYGSMRKRDISGESINQKAVRMVEASIIVASTFDHDLSTIKDLLGDPDPAEFVDDTNVAKHMVAQDGLTDSELAEIAKTGRMPEDTLARSITIDKSLSRLANTFIYKLQQSAQYKKNTGFYNRIIDNIGSNPDASSEAIEIMMQLVHDDDQILSITKDLFSSQTGKVDASREDYDSIIKELSDDEKRLWARMQKIESMPPKESRVTRIKLCRELGISPNALHKRYSRLKNKITKRLGKLARSGKCLMEEMGELDPEVVAVIILLLEDGRRMAAGKRYEDQMINPAYNKCVHLANNPGIISEITDKFPNLSPEETKDMVVKVLDAQTIEWSELDPGIVKYVVDQGEDFQDRFSNVLSMDKYSEALNSASAIISELGGGPDDLFGVGAGSLRNMLNVHGLPVLFRFLCASVVYGKLDHFMAITIGEDDTVKQFDRFINDLHKDGYTDEQIISHLCEGSKPSETSGKIIGYLG